MITANTTAQIATFLNVSPNQIKSITEMAWVFCVVVRGQRARFVSKKVVTEEKMDTSNLYKIHCFNGDVVVVNAKREKLSEGYIVRTGFDCANIVIRVNPMGKDVRNLRVDTLPAKENLGRVEPWSDEYHAVSRIAQGIASPTLVATASPWDTAPFPSAYAKEEACV